MNEVVPINQNVMKFSSEEVELLKTTVAPGLTNAEFKVFMAVCERTRLDPFRRQIYAVKRGGRMVVQTGIDGYRAVAARTGQYAGNEDTVFDNELQPKKATVTVYRLVGGVRCPFTASARWDQYYPGDNVGFQWKKMPHVMLGKCAEGLALRKAFPEDLSGIYTEDEMQQADASTVTAPVRVIDHEVEAMDAHVRDVAEEEVRPVDQVKIALLNELVGKGKPFGPRGKSAKDWMGAIAEQHYDELTEEGCAKIHAAMERKEYNDIPPELR